MIDFTMVLTLDNNHADQLMMSYPNWIKYKPELKTCPVLIICDAKEVKITHPVIKMLQENRKDCQIVFWNPPDGLYANQREKMLTALTVLPGEKVKTPWYLKIDTDSFATNSNKWIYDEWFQKDAVFVSNSWNYTKPANAIQRLDDWADQQPYFKGSKRLDIPFDAKAKRIGHKRIASWTFFGNTQWTKEVASLCKRDDGTYKLPIPSHDTFLFYCAHRMKKKYVRTKFKKLGWAVAAKTKDLKVKLNIAENITQKVAVAAPETDVKTTPTPTLLKMVSPVTTSPIAIYPEIKPIVSPETKKSPPVVAQKVVVPPVAAPPVVTPPVVTPPVVTQKVRTNDLKSTGTHLPVLLSAVSQTTGMVIELGCGHYSTPMLHSVCVPQKRQLVTIESNPISPEKGKSYFNLFTDLEHEYHALLYMNNWDELDITGNSFFDVVFVDAAPASIRVPLIRKFSHNAKYIVCHDAEESHNDDYNYGSVINDFKYVYRYDRYLTETLVLSNVCEFKFL